MMPTKDFWLISIDNSYLSAALVLLTDNQYVVKSVSDNFNWTAENPDSFLNAFDQSLSSAGNIAAITPDQEPNNAAFILPPFWVNADGKIIDTYLKLVETACQKLNLRPLGFIANDEAITETANTQDGIPVSFILLNLTPIFLIYLWSI
jgi:hypothetical protein